MEADKQWASGCVRLEAYVQDGEQRLQEEKTLRERDAQAALATGKATTPLRAASVVLSLPVTTLSRTLTLSLFLTLTPTLTLIEGCDRGDE